jgi:hypothetical protein
VKEPLSFERFGELVAAYGGRLELWPEGERAAGEALLESSERARLLVSAETELDSLFAQPHAVPEASAALLRRLNEIPLRVPQRSAWWPFRRAWIPAVAWAFAAALGVGWGIVGTPFEDGELATTSALTVDSAAPDGGAATDDDLTALARGTLVEFQE